jgi:hypothetical protein
MVESARIWNSSQFNSFCHDFIRNWLEKEIEQADALLVSTEFAWN